MRGKVVIDCFPESALRYKRRYAIVVVDVIRFSTTATTAIAQGMRVFPASSTDEAFAIAAHIKDPLLVGELGGNMPYGFHVNNSPAQIALRTDIDRPIVLVSSSGSELLLNAVGSEAVYTACFRNTTAMADHLLENHERVAILGAGSQRQFRREDQMGCAWVAQRLLEAGYHPETPATRECVSRWKGVSPEEVRGGRSANYLRCSGQSEDLEFILAHIDDLKIVPALVDRELISPWNKARLRDAV